MKLLIVSERCSTFRVKLIDHLIHALLSQNVEVVLLVGEAFNGNVAQEIEVLSPPRFRELSKSMDEHRFLEIFEMAFDDDNFVTLPDFSILAGTFGKCNEMR